LVPGEGDFLLNLHEIVAALDLNLLGQMASEPSGRRSWLERIAKHTDALEALRPDESNKLLEFCLGLTGKTNDKRPTEDKICDSAPQRAEKFFRPRPIDAALHPPQNAIVDVL